MRSRVIMRGNRRVARGHEHHFQSALLGMTLVLAAGAPGRHEKKSPVALEGVDGPLFLEKRPAQRSHHQWDSNCDLLDWLHCSVPTDFAKQLA